MAGIIDFKVGAWNSSGGAFRAMAKGVIEHLLNDEASTRVREALREAVDSNLLYLDFGRDFEERMHAAFESALQRYLADVKARGAAGCPAPDLYPGFVERLNELAAMIERGAKKRDTPA